MAGKIMLKLAELDQIFDLICDFTKEATPSEYCKHPRQEEKAMQKHFAEYMSKWFTVLREVNIPDNPALNEAAEGTWQIDESMERDLEMNPEAYLYITTELKFYGKGMANRNYEEDIKHDLDKMHKVVKWYKDVTMSSILFVSCEKEEAIKIKKIFDVDKGIDIRNVKLLEMSNGYYAIALQIVSYVETAPLHYIKRWKVRFENVIKDGTVEENYFQKKKKSK